MLAWPRLPGQIAILGVALAVGVALQMPAEGLYLWGGIILGVVSRDATYGYLQARFWPLQSLLIDWEKVYELNEKMNAGAEKPSRD